jgi:hypothetical protein
MKVVSPYKPYPPTAPAHRKLGPFDWPGALAMLHHSVQASCRCECYALTDEATEVPIPTLRLPLPEMPLMLWILSVSLAYLESDYFDEDTALVSPDALVFCNLRQWFAGDLGVVVRGPKFERRPLLNGVQLWTHKAKPRLIAFYRQAVELAHEMPPGWGRDTAPLVELLAPLSTGLMSRHGLKVRGIPQSVFFRCPSAVDERRMAKGHQPSPTPIVDFKYLKKRLMADYYAAMFGEVSV